MYRTIKIIRLMCLALIAFHISSKAQCDGVDLSAVITAYDEQNGCDVFSKPRASAFEFQRDDGRVQFTLTLDPNTTRSDTTHAIPQSDVGFMELILRRFMPTSIYSDDYLSARALVDNLKDMKDVYPPSQYSDAQKGAIEIVLEVEVEEKKVALETANQVLEMLRSGDLSETFEFVFPRQKGNNKLVTLSIDTMPHSDEPPAKRIRGDRDQAEDSDDAEGRFLSLRPAPREAESSIHMDGFDDLKAFVEHMTIQISYHMNMWLASAQRTNDEGRGGSHAGGGLY